MSHDVFVSYSTRDKATADAAVATLERHEIRCWVAPRDVTPGAQWADAIVRAIGDSQAMVLVFSGNSNASDHIIREVELAAQHHIPIVPLRVESVLPCPTLDYYIAGTHWLDAIDPPLEAHLDRLATIVRRLIDDRRSGVLGTSLPPTPGATGADEAHPGGHDGAVAPPLGPSPAVVAAATTPVAGASSTAGTAVAQRAATTAPPLPGPEDLGGRLPPPPGSPAPALPLVRLPPSSTGSPVQPRRTLLVGAIVVAVILVAAAAIAVPRIVAGGDEGDVAAATTGPAASTGQASGPSSTVTGATGTSGAVAGEDVTATVRPPRHLHTGYVGAYEVRLLWERASGGGAVDHFIVLRDDERVSTTASRAYTDASVRPSTTYVYRIVAVGTDGTRGSSAELRVRTPAAPTTAPPPTSPPSQDQDPPYDNRAECEAAGWVWLGEGCLPP